MSKSLYRGYTPIAVGGHSYIKLEMSDFLKLNPIPINRDSHLRVYKRKKDFDTAYLKNFETVLTEVAIGIVITDFADANTGFHYSVGDWFIIDGNTRQHYWKQNSNIAEKHKDGLTAKLHYLTNMDDVTNYYYSYDNNKAVEKSTEILQGLKNRYNWSPRQVMFANGGYATALEWASRMPGEDRGSVYEQFDRCYDAIRILDGIPKSGSNTITNPALKGLKSQAIIAAFILSLRYHPRNIILHEMIERLSTITHADVMSAISGGTVDAVHIIAAEYGNLSYLRNTSLDDPNAGWLNGLARGTSFPTQRPQMDFLMYWIQKYIESPKSTWNFKKFISYTTDKSGDKVNIWKDAWDQFHPSNDLDDALFEVVAA